MHDKIKAILPKEKDIREDFRDFFMEESKYCEQSYTRLTPDTIGIIIDYYSKYLAEVHAKIPEIVALVEGEVLKCVPECKCMVNAIGQCEHNTTRALLEALFSNKK